MKFLNYTKKLINTNLVVVVDGHNVQGVNLSHWRNTKTLAKYRADTSGEIVLNYLLANYDLENACFKKDPQQGIITDELIVTATHFDIDGFVGVWSMLNPAQALANSKVLIRLATIGDFREWQPELPYDDKALKLACWLNEEEKKFYVPFGQKDEMEACKEKFDYFLPLFADVLDNIDDYKAIWESEYSQVKADFELLQREGSVKHYPEIGLAVVQVPKPLHYYALFSQTVGYDIVLSMYDNNCYELEYKYLTWVDIVSRPVFPRISLTPLVNYLNLIEKNGKWAADSIMDTGSQLHIRPQRLSKAERFAHPYERTFVPSSIPKESLIKSVVRYFSENYVNISPRNNWTWEDMAVIAVSFE